MLRIKSLLLVLSLSSSAASCGSSTGSIAKPNEGLNSPQRVSACELFEAEWCAPNLTPDSTISEVCFGYKMGNDVFDAVKITSSAGTICMHTGPDRNYVAIPGCESAWEQDYEPASGEKYLVTDCRDSSNSVKGVHGLSPDGSFKAERRPENTPQW